MKLSPWIKIAIGILIGALLAAAGVFFMARRPAEKQLAELARKVNRKAPVVYDGGVRLDSADVMPGKVFRYHYTMLREVADSVSQDSLRRNIDPVLIDNFKRSQQVKSFRDKNITVVFRYLDRDGAPYHEIVITPEMYREE